MSATTATPRGTGATTRNRPIACDVCGLKLRGAANPLLARGLPTCACGGSFQWVSAEDGYRSADPYACPAVADGEAAYDRQLARRAHDVGLGLGRRHAQCGSCRQVMPASARGHCPNCSAVNGKRDGDWATF